MSEEGALHVDACAELTQEGFPQFGDIQWSAEEEVMRLPLFSFRRYGASTTTKKRKRASRESHNNVCYWKGRFGFGPCGVSALGSSDRFPFSFVVVDGLALSNDSNSSPLGVIGNNPALLGLGNAYCAVAG